MKQIFILAALLAPLSALADSSSVNKTADPGVQPAEASLQTNDPQNEMNIYDLKVTAQDGTGTPLSAYQGKVLLIVNTATRCGFTPQYKELQAIYEQYRQAGLEILDFPCNQFGAQAPGSNEEIHTFCTLTFGTTFPRFAKIEVNGAHAVPLYQYLTAHTGGKIKWNFTKFLIDRSGKIIARFEPGDDMDKVKDAIRSAL